MSRSCNLRQPGHLVATKMPIRSQLKLAAVVAIVAVLGYTVFAAYKHGRAAAYATAAHLWAQSLAHGK